MSVLNENQLIGASGAGTSDYEIDNSLRFNGPSEARLSRTPSSASNQKTWTWSAWIKLGKGYSGGSGGDLFYGGVSNSTLAKLQINDGDYGTKDSLWMSFDGGSGYLSENTTALFRDPSAWYHIVWVLDTTISTATDRVKLYVNGVRLTSFTSVFGASSFNNVGQNSNWGVNSTAAHSIGGTNNFFDGYLAEVNLVDGLALTPDSFGETGDYGEWKAKSYAGASGTNGFYLDFKASGSLGNDAAGSNNWTIHNLAATDQMLDSPTNNFATLNVIDDSNSTISEGNLKTVNGGSYTGARATMAFPSTGKWYVEYAEFSTRRSGSVIGALRLSAAGENLDAWPTQAGLYWGQNGLEVTTGGMTTSPFNGIGQGDILQMAYDSDTGKVWLGVNNQWVRASGSTVITDGNPAGGTNQTYTWGSPTEDTFWSIWNYGLTGVANFGSDSSFAGNKTPQSNPDGNDQAGFFYTPPTGFLALCTKNLPSVDVIPSENFNPVIYSGNSSTQSIAVGFQPDFTWIKNRGYTHNHKLLDSVRGATKELVSNTTDAEITGANGLTSFDSNGFTLGSAGGVNSSSYNYVAWNWKAGGSASSNTNGSITSSVSANPSAGFSIVSYTGTGANATVGHGLSQIPSAIILKNRDDGSKNWNSQFTPLGNSYIDLNRSNASYTGTTYFQNTAPTSTLFSIGTAGSSNENGDKFIAYCFHSVDGYSKVGSYTGNGSADGPFVHCGFKPKFVMLKKSSAADNWLIMDTTRDDFNVMTKRLLPNTSAAESTSNMIDMVSNGFKIRTTGGLANTSGATFIFIAFAESPFKHSNAR